MRKTSGNISNMNALLLVPSELAGCIRRKGWQRLTPRAVLELAAPHTWGASVMPVILASAFAISMDGAFSFPLFFSLIATSVCLQCAVNTLNDYSDFISGADRFENCHDPTDASLVYHDYEPVLAFVVGVAFIGTGLLCGLYAIFTVGPELLIFGAVGAAVVFLYSYGILPLSYTPVGEFLSGVVMGGIIPVACFYAFTRQLSVWVLVYSIPVIVTIALIMMTNNGSDIEKDIESARHTLPTRIGRARTKKLHAVFFTAAMAAAAAVAVFRFPQGVWLLPLLCAWLIPNEYKLQNAGLTPENRVISMALSTGANIKLNAVYAAMILLPKISFTQTPISGFFADFFR